MKPIHYFSASYKWLRACFKSKFPVTPSLWQTNENMELTTAIQSEQHVKKELARRMGELQEELHNVKEQVTYPHLL